MKKYENDRSAQLVRDTLRRFPSLSSRRLATYLCDTHGAMFDNFESVRSSIRYHRGLRDARKGCRNPNPIEQLMPKSRQFPREDFILKKGRYGILPDIHIPFHERKPLDIALQWLLDSKVTGIIMPGDAQDCEAISYWLPTKRRDFCDEVEAMCDFLDLLRQLFPKQQIIWQRGNHEDRLSTYYRAHAPELADLPTSDMDTILSLDKRNITLLDRKQKITLHALTILHGHELKGTKSPVNPARWCFLKMKACGAIGHFHATSEDTKQDINRKLISCWSFGCLCDLEPDYNPYGNDWNWGAAMIDYDGTDHWEMQNRKILPTGRLV
jgi:predicted phosphodiesterase